MAVKLRISTTLIMVALTLLLAGCPKRQTVRRLIYVPASPAATEAGATQQSGVLVIAPPPAPVPSEPPPKPDDEEAQTSMPAPEPPPKRRVTQPETASPAADSAPAAPAVTPQLEPKQTVQQQTELRGQIGGLTDGLRQRISRLRHSRLSKDDQKALQDAELLLSGAGQAIQNGDLQQSLNLAQKAELLVSAVENRH